MKQSQLEISKIIHEIINNENSEADEYYGVIMNKNKENIKNR